MAATANANANTVNANAAAQALIGQHIRVTLTTGQEHSGLVFAYERVLGLLVLQAASTATAAGSATAGSISSIASTARVGAAAPAATAAPAAAAAASSSSNTGGGGGAWKSGGPTAAQIVAGKTAAAAAAAAASSPTEAAAAQSHGKQPKALLNVNAATPLPIQKILQRERVALNKERDIAKKIGVNVSKKAQDIFNALDKTLPTRWNGEAILVLDEVMIMPPYGIDDVRGITPTAGTAVDRVQKILQSSIFKK
ncbi:anticodon-binding domain-containing protein [Obelidium mucronatum]|nr:anticodon-binding domain-containing protein [Obelidium mucronatum]